MNLSNKQLLKRLKSLMWRTGMMTLAFFLAALAEGVVSLELSPGLTMILGLVLGEASKALNTKPNLY